MKRSFGILLAVLVTLSACASSAESTTSEPGDPGIRAAVIPGLGASGNEAAYATPIALQPFNQCDALLDYVQQHALDVVTPWGLPGYGYGRGGPVVLEEAFADDAASGAPTAAQPGVDYSTTNVQEAGVDEPDIVKTDGSRIITLANNVLYYVDLTDDGPVITDSLRFTDSWNQDLLLSGDTVLLLGTAQTTPGVIAADAIAPQYYGGNTSTLTQVDVSDPEDLRVVSTMFVDGFYLSARMVGDTARVVVDSFPTGLVFSYPEGSGLRAERTALEANRQIIRESTIDNWLPYYVIENEDGSGSEGVLVDCTSVHHPEEFAGLGTLVVMTLGVGDDLEATASTAIFAEGGTVYASQDNLYVATTQWVDWSKVEDQAPTVTTQIHKFDIRDPEVTTYRASGEVDGYLLNQFAMSEFDGNLRVATTSSPDWWGGGGNDSTSQVIVLGDDNGLLATIGSVGDLGKGERIFSVRFVDETGYVITFRQTDPLYTIDLSDPTDPKTLGELKINGYSAYLHPLDDTLVLGVGQDATDEGRTLGSQVSLFDISDLTNPQRVDRMTVDDGYSEVEWDHRAFLYWPAEEIAVVPLSRYSWDEETETDDYFAGALVIRINDDGLSELTRITHATDDEGKWNAQIQRSLVVGNELYTISPLGMMATGLDDFETDSFVRW